MAMSTTLPEASVGELIHRHGELAQISEPGPGVTRCFATPEHLQAIELLKGWMEEAGLETRVDPVGNLIGRYAAHPDIVEPKVLLMGSHHDTVRQGGAYDGAMGVLLGIACADALYRLNRRLHFHLDIIAFADEEGTRFATSLLGSRAVAGRFLTAILDWQDAQGTTIQQAMAEAGFAAGLAPDRLAEAAYPKGSVLGYVEAHIEQGPVLEAEELPVGVVTAIAHGTRHRLTVGGMAGHAGTVPMNRRKDALACAAEMLLAVERGAVGDGVVATVGQIEASPGSINVIPGKAVFSLDLRAPSAELHEKRLAETLAACEGIAAARGLEISIDKLYNSGGCTMDAALTAQLEAAIAANGWPVRRLPSGAGHDAMALTDLCPVAMIFVRCSGGISHNPAEHVDPPDLEAALRVLFSFLVASAPSTKA